MLISQKKQSISQHESVLQKHIETNWRQHGKLSKWEKKVSIPRLIFQCNIFGRKIHLSHPIYKLIWEENSHSHPYYSFTYSVYTILSILDITQCKWKIRSYISRFFHVLCFVVMAIVWNGKIISFFLCLYAANKFYFALASINYNRSLVFVVRPMFISWSYTYRQNRNVVISKINLET